MLIKCSLITLKEENVFSLQYKCIVMLSCFPEINKDQTDWKCCLISFCPQSEDIEEYDSVSHSEDELVESESDEGDGFV